MITSHIGPPGLGMSYSGLLVIVDRVNGVPFFLGAGEGGIPTFVREHINAIKFAERRLADRVASVIRVKRPFLQVLPLSAVAP